MRSKLKIFRHGDPGWDVLFKDLGAGAMFPSGNHEKYSVEMLEEDGLRRVRRLVFVTPPGSAEAQ